MRGWYHVREQQRSFALCIPRAKGHPRTGTKGAGKGRPQYFNSKSNSPGRSVVMRQLQGQSWQDLSRVQWSLAGPWWWGRAKVKGRLQSWCGLRPGEPDPMGRHSSGCSWAPAAEPRAGLEWGSGPGLGCSSWGCSGLLMLSQRDPPCLQVFLVTKHHEECHILACQIEQGFNVTQIIIWSYKPVYMSLRSYYSLGKRMLGVCTDEAISVW